MFFTKNPSTLLTLLKRNRAAHIKVALLLVMSVCALLMRYILIPFRNLEIDLSLIPWYDFIVQNGGYRALAVDFSNYSPPYLYLLYFSTLLSGLSKIAAIKLFSIIGDFAAASLMFLIVRSIKPQGWAAYAAFGITLFSPMIIVNSSLWGQCDVLYSTALLLCIYLILKDRQIAAMIAFGTAVAFKAQAFFLIPFLSVLIFKGRLNWRYAILIPITYLAWMLPAALAGRPWAELIGIYFNQADTFTNLSRNAPNIYAFVSDENYSLGLKLGLIITAAGVLSYVIMGVKSRIVLNNPEMLLLATLSLTLMPFLLPKMHERYFYAAALLSLSLPFCIKRTWFIPVGLQVTSLLAYLPFLYYLVNQQIAKLLEPKPWFELKPEVIAYLFILAVIGNILLVPGLFVITRKFLYPVKNEVTSAPDAPQPSPPNLLPG
jgi:Gpi18-like mannosyltransferase